MLPSQVNYSGTLKAHVAVCLFANSEAMRLISIRYAPLMALRMSSGSEVTDDSQFDIKYGLMIEPYQEMSPGLCLLLSCSVEPCIMGTCEQVEGPLFPTDVFHIEV